MPPRTGQPPKKKKNISGLKNQSALINISAGQIVDNDPDQDHRPHPDSDAEEDPPRQDIKDMASSEQEDELNSDFDSNGKWTGLTKRQKTYIKGPDVMSKSLHTQRCYAQGFQNQATLNGFVEVGQSIPQAWRVSDCSISEGSEASVKFVHMTYNINEDSKLDSQGVSPGPSVTKADLNSNAPEDSNKSDSEDNNEEEEEESSPPDHADMETWEEELEEDIANCPQEIKDWSTLRAQIKADLKIMQKSLPSPRSIN
ncbi:hypothetical protein CVT25_008462 [Psilocybe cyanescens]|uniref:Uncharacterized protein n=1 Tax=Psilocybe cyanescens TaxID=93625 RepID=A0A409X6X3_PSICY|nr:hypothetical protein CVT25_008462 [Psilocybe cyanescens]